MLRLLGEKPFSSEEQEQLLVTISGDLGLGFWNDDDKCFYQSLVVQAAKGKKGKEEVAKPFKGAFSSFFHLIEDYITLS